MFDFYQPDFQPTKLYPFQNLSLNILINIYLIEKKRVYPNILGSGKGVKVFL